MPTNRGKFILMGLAGLLVGIAVGAIGGSYFTTKILSAIKSTTYCEKTETVLGSQWKLAALVELQQGHIKNARESLENALDSDILGLGLLGRDESILGALKQIHHYRSEHPWHSPIPGMDQQVAKVLDTAEKQ